MGKELRMRCGGRRQIERCAHAAPPMLVLALKSNT